MLDRTLGPVLTRSTPAAGAATLVDRVAAACRAALGATTDDQVAIALTRGLAATSRDTDALLAWLGTGRTSEGVDLDPGLRWSTVARLAALGALDADAVEAERQRDQTFAGELGAARALAARPTPEAKAAAWSAMSAPDVSNRVFEATALGLWDPEHVDLCTTYVDAYLADSPAICERRGQGFSLVVGRNAFPALELSPAQRQRLADTLASGSVPSVLARFWNDQLDDLR